MEKQSLSESTQTMRTPVSESETKGVLESGMEEEKKPIAQEPELLRVTEPLPGQECYLYGYVLLEKEVDGVIGFYKMISVHGDPKDAIEDFKRAYPTNKGVFVKWGETGKWEALRRPETDIEGSIDIVRIEDEESSTIDFYGEKLKRESKVAEKTEVARDRAVIDKFKQNRRQDIAERKRVELRKKALQELEEEVENKDTLAHYASLHWKRLTQKSAIQEMLDKAEEAKKALVKTIAEIQEIDEIHEDYASTWQDEVRRISRIYKPKGENPVDNPITTLTTEDDQDVLNSEMEPIDDPYATSIGAESGTGEVIGKGKEEIGDSSEEPPELIGATNPVKSKPRKSNGPRRPQTSRPNAKRSRGKKNRKRRGKRR